MPNAFEVGPDGMLYFPAQAANEIWRVDLEGGGPEIVAKDLGVPDSVKFDAKGFIVSTQIGTGEVLRIDPRTGERSVLASIEPGLDNCALAGERLFVSHISGSIVEVLANGNTRTVVRGGLQWPMGIAVSGAGVVYVADAMLAHRIVPGSPIEKVGSTIASGFPGIVRGVAADGQTDWVVTTSRGDVARWSPGGQAIFLAQGLGCLMGVAIGKGGAAVFAEFDTGRLMWTQSGDASELAVGLDRPTGVAVDSNGTVFVAESGSGRVGAIRRGRIESVVAGLIEPHGIAIHNERLFILDVGSKQLIESDISGTGPRVIAAGLPVGAPPATATKPLGGFGNMSGPLLPFSGLAAGQDGSLYIAADTEGSVMCLRPQKDLSAPAAYRA